MNDHEHMQFALSLAKKVRGQTSPNPPVGAVVVKDGNVVGFGAHMKAGEAHAEVHALDMAADKARGADIYVTLEPCSHHGKTPPCTDAIIKSGIKRVIIATPDANEKIATKGIKTLERAGIAVTVGVLEEEAQQLNEVFFHYITTKKPFVTVKTAMSLDGKIATAAGESKWITGEAARLDVHHYRHTHDAILVGVNTVIADDPSLTTRLPLGGRNPIRVILDTWLRTPNHAKVAVDEQAATWIFTGSDVSEQQRQKFTNAPHVQIISLKKKTVELEDVLQTLGEKGIMTLFVEGGAEVNGSFLKAGAINQLIMYMAATLIGGRGSPAPFGGEGISSLANAPKLQITHYEKIADDLKIIAKPIKEDADVYRNY